MTNPLIRKIRNFLAPPNVSGCGICGDKWNWKKKHVTKFSKTSGAFPICEECWQTRSPEEIMSATKSLVNLWLVQSPWKYYEDTRKRGEMLIEATREALKQR